MYERRPPVMDPVVAKAIAEEPLDTPAVAPAIDHATGGGDASALLPWIDDLSIGSGAVERDEVRHTPAPKRVADSGPHIPKGAKYQPNWTALAHGSIHDENAPELVVLPDAVDKGLSKSWSETVNDPKHREHGGNIVRYYNGEYGVRHGEVGTQHFYDPDYEDKGRFQDHVGIFHTHPYMDEGYDHGTFSGGDFANMADHDLPMSVMRSGSNNTYMIARSKEFQARVDAIENKYSGEELMDKRRDFRLEIEGTYDEAEAAWLKAHPGDFMGALDAAAAATSKKYQLPYYAGKGKELHRVSAPTKT